MSKLTVWEQMDMAEIERVGDYYEEQLRAKDAQIAALVTALKAYMEWEPATILRGDYRTIMYRAAEAAIEEATNAS